MGLMIEPHFVLRGRDRRLLWEQLESAPSRLRGVCIFQPHDDTDTLSTLASVHVRAMSDPKQKTNKCGTGWEHG